MTEKWSRRNFIVSCVTCAFAGISTAFTAGTYFSIGSQQRPPPVRMAVDFEAAAVGSSKLTVAKPLPLKVGVRLESPTASYG